MYTFILTPLNSMVNLDVDVIESKDLMMSVAVRYATPESDPEITNCPEIPDEP